MNTDMKIIDEHMLNYSWKTLSLIYHVDKYNSIFFHWKTAAMFVSSEVQTHFGPVVTV